MPEDSVNLTVEQIRIVCEECVNRYAPKARTAAFWLLGVSRCFACCSPIKAAFQLHKSYLPVPLSERYD